MSIKKISELIGKEVVVLDVDDMGYYWGFENGNNDEYMKVLEKGRKGVVDMIGSGREISIDVLINGEMLSFEDSEISLDGVKVIDIEVEYDWDNC